MVPPSTRRRISTVSSQIARIVKSGALWSGKGIYVLSTSLMLVGIPFALAYVDEHQALEIEREQKARETAGEVSCCCLFFRPQKCGPGVFPFLRGEEINPGVWLLRGDGSCSIGDVKRMLKGCCYLPICFA